MRLIDADALEKKLQEQRELYVEMGMKGAEHLLVHDFLRYVWEAPRFSACSVCGYLEYECNEGNYCPECGAKMDGGKE